MRVELAKGEIGKVSISEEREMAKIIISEVGKGRSWKKEWRGVVEKENKWKGSRK